MKKIICLFIVTILTISILGCSKNTDTEIKEEQSTQQPTPTIEQQVAVDKLPDFESVDLLNNKITQDIFRDSKLTIVNLWGTF